MKIFFLQSPKLTTETKIILLAMGLLVLLRIVWKDLKPFLFDWLVGVLIGMLYMHLHDVKKFKAHK